jgi:hypothetical protein
MAVLLVYAFLLGFSFYIARTWVRWFRNTARVVDPKWRSIVTTLGFTASSSSLLVIDFLAVHAIFTGGFPYYSPPLMFAFRVGFLTALAGVLGAIVGKGPLEVPTIVSSALCLLIWFVEAVAQ